MALEGYLFPKCPTSSYCDAAVVRGYLKDYAHHFDLLFSIKHRVNSVSPILPASLAPGVGPQWHVTVENLLEQSSESMTFDAALVCSGKQHRPVCAGHTWLVHLQRKHYPQHAVPQSESLQEQAYRTCGSGLSSRDTSQNMAKEAQKVIISQRPDSPQKFTLSRQFHNILETGPVSYSPEGVVLEDETEEAVDVIILCTGFKFDFPF
ncbi:hypothetical protein BV898_05410 [Hypsibius exemplaris]|uniref:Flavin-containing monooxygenase n=1 Tax=Hypsibius exemplaris TaxID=2072580 RepID=A0A1W0WZG6_HYPEX|nr:hypothetical protein BV898_05410 [Hypsibius exemplaris]